jgi:ketosteroid isomerase-like protein
VVGKPDDFTAAHLYKGAPIRGVNGSVRTDRHAAREGERFVGQRDVLVRMREGDFLHVTATWDWTLVSEINVGEKLRCLRGECSAGL